MLLFAAHEKLQTRTHSEYCDFYVSGTYNRESKWNAAPRIDDVRAAKRECGQCGQMVPERCNESSQLILCKQK